MKKFEITFIYSIIHALVDMSTAMIIAGILTPILNGKQSLFIAILIYNLFAFGLQLPFGIIADKFNKNSLVSSIGCIIIAISYVMIYIIGDINDIIGIIVCGISGIGNALFHIGGGIDVLNFSDKKASLSGIFVSTGALGLYIGSNINAIGFNKFYIMPIIMSFSAILLIYIYFKNKYEYRICNAKFEFKDLPKEKEITVMFLFIIICFRGYIGSILKFDWNTNFYIGLITVISVCLGKAIGGIIGDKFGWKRTIILTLILSSILFVFADKNMICALIAILLFNMTMPITLVALSNIFNNNKGIAFGLNTLALILGALPVLFGVTLITNIKMNIPIFTFISAVLSFYGLKQYEKNIDINGERYEDNY